MKYDIYNMKYTTHNHFFAIRLSDGSKSFANIKEGGLCDSS